MKQHPALKGMKSTFIGIIVNALLALLKAMTGIFGNSYALVADAIESTADVFSSLIVWMGLKISSKPPDHDHPYGHGKAEPMAAVIVSLSLFIAAFVIVIQSIRELILPHHTPASYTLVVLVFAIIVKEFLFRFLFRVGKDVGSIAVKTDAWHHRSDAFTSAAAFVGISIALIGGPGYESADTWAALVASGVILFNAIRLLKPAVGELMDASPSPVLEKEIRTVALTVDGVESLDKCTIRKVGFDFYVDLHVRVKGTMSVRRAHSISHTVKDTICSSNERIANVLIHIEPGKN